MLPPADQKATSTPSKLFSVNSSTTNLCPSNSISFPALLAEANNLILSKGKLNWKTHLNISRPTAPVAPTIAILNFFIFIISLSSYFENNSIFII